MNFELAKKLKDSGFPYIDYKKSRYSYRGENENTEFVEKPILSELIEACIANERQFCLTQESGDGDGTPNKKNPFWQASIIVKNGHEEKIEGTTQWINESIEKIGEGSTPEEAMANLWLRLKNKI